MDHATLVAVFVVIAAIAIVIDTVMILGFFLIAWRIYRYTSEVRRRIKLDGEAIVIATRDIVDIVRRLKEPINSLAANLTEISRLVRDRAASLDAAVGDVVDRTRSQTERIDLLVSNLVDQVESTVATAQRAVAGPVQEVAAVARGVQAGIDFFFSRHPPSIVREAAQDEEMFI